MPSVEYLMCLSMSLIKINFSTLGVTWLGFQLKVTCSLKCATSVTCTYTTFISIKV